MKFKVWKSEADGKFYNRMLFGNHKTVWDTQGYDEARSAFHACDLAWKGALKAIMGQLDLAVSPPSMPTPYTKDSLKPKVKP